MLSDNETSVYEVPNAESDGSTFDLPDTDGSGEVDPNGDDLENNTGEDDAAVAYDVRGEDSALIKIVNGWDVNVDVTLQGTTFDDAGADEPADDQTAKTISSGSTDYIAESEPWAYILASVAPASNPSSGTLKLVFQSDRTGAP